MNIFYYSVHQILEDDEIRLFQQMGHNVFCLGINRKGGATQSFRESIKFNPIEEYMFDDYVRRGGNYDQHGGLENVLPFQFEGHFNVFIIMHDVSFITRFWDRLKGRNVIWRTIGQGVNAYDAQLKTMRAEGLKIVRYSPKEAGFSEYLGEEATIRFYKDPEIYVGWTGHIESVLTFSNMMEQRYPREADVYRTIAQQVPCALGGGNNENLPGATGLLSFDNQTAAYQGYRVYLYLTGLEIPYTLNFIEAWMTGIPVVVYAPIDKKGAYYEIDELVKDGVDGFICRSVNDVISRCKELINDKNLALRIGAAGRTAAISYFGKSSICKQWESMLSTIEEPQKSIKSNLVSKIDIFNTLKHLRPFDINISTKRVGPARDGGYVLADIFDGQDVISFGISNDVRFEKAMAVCGHRCFMYDHTVEGPPETDSNFNFFKLGVSGSRNETEQLLSIKSHLSRIDHTKRLILKIDVEGAEWDVFSSIEEEDLIKFEQIVGEFHWFFDLEQAPFLEKVKASMKKLTDHFTLFHVHANNCARLGFVNGFAAAEVLELSFIRNDLAKKFENTRLFPVASDKGNDLSLADHALLFFPFLPTISFEDKTEEVIVRIESETFTDYDRVQKTM